MKKEKYTYGSIIVEVSISPLNKPEPKNHYTIYDCFCHGDDQHKQDPRKKYQITASSVPAAAQLAFHFYQRDFSDGNE